MAREEFDESLYRRPEKKNAGEEENKKTEDLPKDGATAGEDPADGWKRRSAWDNDEEDAEKPEQPRSRRKFMPDDDEEPGKEEGPDQQEKPAEKDAGGADGGQKKKNGGKKAPDDARKGRKRITSGASFYGDDEKHTGLRKGLVWFLCIVLFIVVAAMTLSSFISSPALERPKSVVSRVVAPVQRLFSGFVDTVADYVRTLKVRGELEYEYGEMLKKMDDLASEAAMAEEYKHQLDQLYDLMDEMKRNTDMNPVSASVIGHDTGNYFSVLTIDVGSNQGVSENMAVVFSGGLVGYTYNVKSTTCNVLCVIDSNATVAAMVQNTRDQGSLKGTLSDGSANCRMYYLPDDSLPRPGDLVVTSGVGVEFPVGIPIGHVRESTRGMDDNKSYVVVEPIVDFQHLEYVVVYRYRPPYTQPVQQRSSYGDMTPIPLETPRPTPVYPKNNEDGMPVDGTEETPEPSPGPSDIPEPTPAPTPGPDVTPVPETVVYNPPESIAGTPTPSPTPEPTPTPTPVPTFDPGTLTVEEDEP
ncbi:MAG: rod shape-determining protein MreC [Clostridia bacterium]|nr:rod shape-determining protein MreC [Clostridia bacterium]